MKPTDSQPASKAVRCDDLLGFLRGKLAAAEQALRSREQGEECWRDGTSETWRKVGCKLTKAQRLRLSEKEGRIAEKCRREVAMFKAVIAALDKPNDQAHPTAAGGTGGAQKGL